MKKNNPGCNCCGDVLIWNLDNEIPCNVRRAERISFPALPQTEYVNPRNGTDTNWVQLTFENFKSTLRADGIKVDEVNRLNPNNWSGSIDNYKLIIWTLPNRAPDCDLCPNKEDPEWWPSVQNGDWSGRIVILFDSPYEHVVFEESWRPPGVLITLESDCSMLAEEDALLTAPQSFFQQSELTVNWPTAGFGSINGTNGVTFSDPSTHPLMENVSRLYHLVFHEVNGGTDVATTTWTGSSGAELTDSWIREVVVGGQSRIVCGDTTHMTDTLTEAVLEDDNNKQFWRNLFRVPVS